MVTPSLHLVEVVEGELELPGLQHLIEKVLPVPQADKGDCFAI